MEKTFLTVLSVFILYIGHAQSFDDAKKSAINYIRRVYNAAPFEGSKKIEGEEANYYVVTVSFENLSPDSVFSKSNEALKKAQVSAEMGFAEPTVKFEMVEVLKSDKRSTFLYLCETL